MNTLRLIFFATGVVILFFFEKINAQPAEMTKHWSFDNGEAEYSALRNTSNSPVLSEGINKQGYWMSGALDYLRIYESQNPAAPFSLSFWLRPVNVGKQQTVLQHNIWEANASKSSNQLVINLKNQKLMVIVGARQAIVAEPVFENEHWYFFTYISDGRNIRLLLQGQAVFQTPTNDLLLNRENLTDEFIIGKGFSPYQPFEGVIDEISTYRGNISKKITAVNANVEPSPVILPKNQPSLPENTVAQVTNVDRSIPIDMSVNQLVPKGTNLLRIKPINTAFIQRNEDIQYNLTVKNQDIVVTIWDYDEFDNDRISLTLINDDVDHISFDNQLLNKESEKASYKLKLQANADNQLTLSVDDMGLYDAQNTVALSISAGNQVVYDKLKIVLTEETNAVINLKHEGEVVLSPPPAEPVAVVETPPAAVAPTKSETPAVPIAKPEKPAPSVPVAEPVAAKPQYAIVQDYAVVDPLVVRSTGVTIEFIADKRQKEKQQFTLSLDGTPIGDLHTSSRQSKRVNFDIHPEGESVVIVESHDLLLTDKFRLNMRIMNGGREIAAYSLRLDQYNVMIPFAILPKPDDGKLDANETKTIVVNNTNFAIQVRDFSKVDGDAISVYKDGAVVLENYILQEELYALNTNLTPNAETLFTFKPLSMGAANTENTAWVQVVSDGKVVDQFSMTFREMYEQIKLKVVHKPAE